jgi:hypothetical protein
MPDPIACGFSRSTLRRVAVCLYLTLAAWTATAPASLARADCAPGSPCVTVPVGAGAAVRYPRLAWAPIAEARQFGPGDHDIRLIQGDATQVLNDAAARALGLRGADITRVPHPFGANAPLVFARYVPGSNELRIDAIRIERSPTGVVRVAQALFGPHHGDHWAAYGKYLSAAERIAGRTTGINPFARFADPKDDIFHRIGPDGMLVAVGHAMRHLGATLGLIAVTDLRFQQREIDDGGLLTTKTTYIIDGYAKPDWWIASPLQVQTLGKSDTAICVGSEDPANCLPHHVATAGISVMRWQGGNMPATEDHLYHWQDTKSGFSVLGMAVLTGLLVFAGAYVFGPQIAGGGFSVTAGEGAATVLESAAQLGLASSGAYIAGSDVLHPGSIFDIQQGFLGNTISRGDAHPMSGNSAPAAALQQSARNLQINTKLNAGLTSVQVIYKGRCAETSALRDCASSRQEAGIVPRSDTYQVVRPDISLASRTIAPARAGRTIRNASE